MGKHVYIMRVCHNRTRNEWDFYGVFSSLAQAKKQASYYEVHDYLPTWAIERHILNCYSIPNVINGEYDENHKLKWDKFLNP